MKITKSVLSILAIAISSSAFASSYPEQIQNYKQEIQPKLDSSSYDIVNTVAYANILSGARGSDASDVEFTSAQKEFITKKIVLPIRTEVCAEAFRELSNGESEVEAFNKLPADAPIVPVNSLVAIKASSLLASCSFINPDTHKMEILGLDNGVGEKVWGYKAKIYNSGVISEF